MDTNLAEAIKVIQSTAVAAVPVVKTVTIKIPDGSGGNLDLPVVQGDDPEGGQSLESTLPFLREAAEFAKKLRLEQANGPDFRTGTANLQSLESFVDHANRFKSASSAVWADAAQRKLVSVLDYHPAGAEAAPAWGRHRGIYACPVSEAWATWGGISGLQLSQDAFASLLDSRDRELATGQLPFGSRGAPDPATLITLANNLEVFSHASAKRERDQNTGRVKVSFSEENGVVGTITPPPAFLICIPVFQDSVPQNLEVRLTVEVKDGEATFKAKIHAASDVLRVAFLTICSHVLSMTSLPVFTGTPEA